MHARDSSRGSEVRAGPRRLHDFHETRTSGPDSLAVTPIARTSGPTREKTLPHVEAQVCRHEAELRTVQRRFDEAIALLDRVAEIGRETPDAGLLAECLLERADVARISGDAATAVEILEDLEEARGLARAKWDWQWKVLFDLWLLVLVRLGDKNELAEALPEARRLAGKLDGDGSAFSSRLRWFEGHVNRDREALTEARERFIAAGDDLWSARTALDLLAGGPWDGPSETGGGLDALQLASELATALGAMAQSSQGVAVAKLMQSKAASGAVSRRILDAAGGVLRQSEDDLRAREALRFVGE